MMSESEIFDRHLRRVRRDRAARLSMQQSVIDDLVADDLLDRLSGIQHSFSHALLLNGRMTRLAAALRAQGMNVLITDPGAEYAAYNNGIQCDEDRLPFAAESFDLILNVGLLDTVHDVPGAMLLMRRALKPGGLMLTAFLGAGSGETLRAALRRVAADSQHSHPLIDVRGGGDLLSRTGYQRAVADTYELPLHYPSFGALLRDMRAHAATNVLTHQVPITKFVARQLINAFEPDAPITETLAILTLTGWAAP